MFLSTFSEAYKKTCNTQHVVIKMIEELKDNLDKKIFIGVVLTDLSK